METAPSTDEAKQWQGWGTALKPAHEPIVVARKPLIGTVVENVLTHGTGGINIDGARVKGDKGTGNWKGVTNLDQSKNIYAGGWDASIQGSEPILNDGTIGRWPANVIHDGSDEVVELFPSVKGATSRTPTKPTNATSYVLGGDSNTPIYDDGLNTSAARFFYSAKTSKRDRNEGLDEFETKQTTGGGGLTSIGDAYGSIKAPAKNFHPTVKPTDLMRYLCRLVTPPNGTVLDPFMGSGSTGKAAVLEGFDFIGIEQDVEYIKIAEARIAYASKSKEEFLF